MRPGVIQIHRDDIPSGSLLISGRAGSHRMKHAPITRFEQVAPDGAAIPVNAERLVAVAVVL
jgi:hypothetical protein